MRILSADEIRSWDQFTIAHEPVTSLRLMERAASKCADWILEHKGNHSLYAIFCGKGNNGGDGLAIARKLMEHDLQVSVHILELGHKGTDDFQANLTLLHKIPGVSIHFIQSEENFHSFDPGTLVIDALFGSGLNRKLDGVSAKLVDFINTSGCPVISIDIPSGLFVDHSSAGNTAIKATHTLSFQCYKPAFLVAENAEFIGDVHIINIGLHPDYLQNLVAGIELLDDVIIHSIYKRRKRFSHKGNFGHALLVSGSYGKIGAAVLSAKSCLRSGVGLLTCHIPKCGYDILQATIPEAMVMTDSNSFYNTKTEADLSKYNVIGIGPGIGTAPETLMLLPEIFNSFRSPVVMDADALNLLSTQKNLIKSIPAGSVLTPHPKEFVRLFGESANDFEQIQLALQKAKELNLVIVLKGHHTLIAAPDGKGFFNSTGNAGMATAGSGDVLTGILTGLLAQGYSSIESALLGVYLHGLAGDLAATELSLESLIAGDIIQYLGKGFTRFNHFH